MVLKLYLHFAGPPEHTKVFKIAEESETTGADVLMGFADAYNRQHTATRRLKAASLSLKSELGARIDSRKAVVGSIKNGSYLVVTLDSPAKEELSVGNGVSSLPKALRGALSEPNSASPATDGSSSSGRPSTQRPKSGGAVSTASALTKPFLEKAADAESKQHYKIAATIYRQVLNAAPQNYEALLRLARLWMRVKRPANALPLAKSAAEHYPKDVEARKLLADCLWATGEKEAALQEFTAAVSLAVAQKEREDQLRVQAAMAALLYSMGGAHKEAAAQLIMSTLESDEGHSAALHQYAVIAQERGMVEEATRVFLRLLVLRQDDVEVKLRLAQCLQREEGMRLVQTELAGNPARAAALAFLATAVKDHGAVPTCIRLFQMAVAAAPESPSYALNLMHAYELQQDYNAAVQAADEFCRSTRLQLGGGFEFAEAARALEDIPRLTEGPGSEWLRLEPWAPRRANFPTETDMRAAEEAGMRLDANGDACALEAPADDGCGQVEYTPEELDALALLFTTVKVLYLGGAVARAARMIQMIQVARTASRKALHTTLIRNEAAYFSCIAQLLREHPPPPLPAAYSPLYLCGDSHTLSGAWHTLRVRGEVRLLVPLLVTGCKIWHLRPASRFYPKMAWLSTIQKLPNGSQVVFMFGEIDCREGLLLAVDKLKYESMEDAVRVLIGIYSGVLLELIRSRGFEIFVHPVPSVLNETRHVVQPFNKALKAEIQQVAGLAEAGGKLHWLDLFDELLTPDGLRMKPSLQFDGTHMNPGYVRIIEKVLEVSGSE